MRGGNNVRCMVGVALPSQWHKTWVFIDDEMKKDS